MPSNMWYSSLLRHLLTLLLTALLGGLLGATLVRFGPGFGVDERELDTRLHEDSIQALRRSHSEERNLFHFYASYLNGAVHGNLGVSHSFARPVSSRSSTPNPGAKRTKVAPRIPPRRAVTKRARMCRTRTRVHICAAIQTLWN